MGRDFEDANENNGAVIIPAGEGAPPVIPGTAYGTVDRSNINADDSGLTTPLDLNIYGAAQNKAHPIAEYAQAQTNKVLDKAVYNNSAPAGSVVSNALKAEARQKAFEDYSSKYGDTPSLVKGATAQWGESKPEAAGGDPGDSSPPTVYHQDDWLKPDTGKLPAKTEYNDETRDMTPQERQKLAAYTSATLTASTVPAYSIPVVGPYVAAGLGGASAYVGTMGGDLFDGAQMLVKADPQRWLDKQKSGEAD